MKSWNSLTKQFLGRIPNGNTQKQYKNSLGVYKQYMDKAEVDPLGKYKAVREGIIDWVFHSSTRNRKATVQTRLAAVSKFYQFLVTEELGGNRIVKNPAQDVPIWDDDLPSQPKFPSAELADRYEALLREQAGSGVKPLRDWLLFRFLTEGGFRVSELCNIRVQDVYPDGKINVPVAKGNKSRFTAVLPETLETMQKFVTVYRLLPDDWLFMPHQMYEWTHEQRRRPLKGATKLTPDAVSAMLKRNSVKLGFEQEEVKKLQSPHGYRHLWAVRQLEAGTGEVFVMLMGGWKNIEMLEHYVGYASPGVKAVERR
jgi:integrase/recombinase XerD